ncbi:MAG: hypothetical protein HY301_07195 [Verrucomicrobia bacterium]|nr:hypothetical protein [Verrucomicrobiota bacterium]
MSTFAEIEAAIEQLSAGELRRLRERLLARPDPAAATTPKTGAELAALWPKLFHLTATEADTLAADMDLARRRQSPPRSLAWE